MTDVLDERETLTQPIPHRRYSTVYDVNATAILRPGEGMIFDSRPTDTFPVINGREAYINDSVEIPRVLDEMLDEEYGTAPTTPPKIPTQPPKKYRSRHRKIGLPWRAISAITGAAVLVFAAGIAEGLMLAGAR